MQFPTYENGLVISSNNNNLLFGYFPDQSIKLKLHRTFPSGHHPITAYVPYIDSYYKPFQFTYIVESSKHSQLVSHGKDVVKLSPSIKFIWMGYEKFFYLDESHIACLDFTIEPKTETIHSLKEFFTSLLHVKH